MSSHLANGARLDVAAHAQAIALSIVTELMNLIDGDVIALVLLHSRVSQEAKRDQNHADGDAETDEFAVIRGHFAKSRLSGSAALVKQFCASGVCSVT